MGGWKQVEAIVDGRELEKRGREAYIRALEEEREAEIRKRTLQKAEVITRSMRPEEKEEYLRSKAFQNALNQTRKKDRTWQAIHSGELPEEWEAEYQRLRPMIESEMGIGRKAELAFLRSAARTRRPIRECRQARSCIEEKKVQQFLTRSAGKIAGEMDRDMSEWLSRGDLTQMIRREEIHGSVAEGLMKTVFRGGLPVRAIDAAAREGSLGKALERRAYRQFPVLRSCRNLRIGPEETEDGKQPAPEETQAGSGAAGNGRNRDRAEEDARDRGRAEGKTVAEGMREQIQAAEGEIVRLIRAHFPQGRIRKCLKQNPNIQRQQRERERNQRDRKQLREALLKAIPEEMKDLYPLARGMHRKFILHLGPTNSGKTWESIQRLQTARHGIYLGPLRLLAFEQFEGLNLADVPCSLVTGEERILVPDSRIQSSTIEMADLETEYDIAVIDECQMIADRDRGGAWSAAVLGLCAEEIHICASPDAEGLLTAMITDCGDEMRIVRHERMAPLAMEEGGFHFPSGVRKGDALIVFSKARVHALAAELKQKGFEVSLIYGALPPDVRRNQAERFRRGETEVVVSTDAIAMGMNLPIARVVFMEGEKFDGDITRQLTDSEIRQIAGRAGRYGQYDIGYVNAYGFKTMVAGALARPAMPLTTAVIRFPESLLGLPLTLTETLNQWISMKDRDYFSKASTMRMMSLAARMETPKTDKRLLYEFLCIPFDEEEPRLLEIWKSMYHAESIHGHYDVEAVLPEFRDPETCTVAMLDRLEADYRLCDLCYNYARRFLDRPDSLLAEIQQRKELISSGIIHVLSTQKLPGRRCRTCGKPLPWNWPYAICDRCHASNQPMGYRRRGGGRNRG